MLRRAGANESCVSIVRYSYSLELHPPQERFARAAAGSSHGLGHGARVNGCTAHVWPTWPGAPLLLALARETVESPAVTKVSTRTPRSSTASTSTKATARLVGGSHGRVANMIVFPRRDHSHQPGCSVRRDHRHLPGVPSRSLRHAVERRSIGEYERGSRPAPRQRGAPCGPARHPGRRTLLWLCPRTRQHRPQTQRE